MPKFGFLSKIEILQNVPSKIIANLNPAITHNIEKYKAIKKAFYISSIENISGDYFEFGVFSGSSFCHAIRCAKALEKFDEQLKMIHFFGYDSFEGFGNISEIDKHKFYTDINFETSYKKTKQRILKLVDESKFTLVKGFFEDSLSSMCTKKARIVFIDSDTYNSAKAALNFLKQSIQEGTIIILDDFFSYRGSLTKGVAGATYEFMKKMNVQFRELASYGMGGKVVIVSKIG